MFRAILWTQVATFAVGSVLFFREGNWRLGAAQLALSFVQAVIYI